MLAECENELNNTAAVRLPQPGKGSGQRIDALIIRLAQFPTSTKAEVAKAIIHEKTVEMGGEKCATVIFCAGARKDIWRQRSHILFQSKG